jgi:hypothetical protein
VTEVRAVGAEAFAEIYPLLREFPTKAMTEEDWRRMLFATPWSDNPQRGFALYAEGKPVGFIGTIFSQRRLGERVEPICSLSSWIMLPDHRSDVLKLLLPILKLRNHTILNPTPSPVAYGIFAQLGFVPLESERLILPPLPGGDTAGTLSGSFTTSKADLEAELTGEEAALYRDHSWCAAARHVLLRRGERRCYLVATAMTRKGLPFAEIQYVSDWDLFWKLRLLAHAALFSTTRGLALFVDRRFTDGRRRLLSATWRCPRLYRPAHKGIAPDMIDGLYSEMMNLKW